MVEVVINKQGCYDISAAEYHADPVEAISLSSGLVKVLVDQSPAHARLAHPRLNPNFRHANKREFDIGHAFHALFLEGEDAATIIQADNYRTKAAQEARDAAYATGKIPLLPHDFNDVQRMAEAARRQLAAHEDSPNAFSDGKSEQTLIWQERGVWCRARLDWKPNSRRVYTDLKSTSVSANPEQWIRTQLFGMGGDIQAAFYCRGIRKVLGIKAPVFQFCVVETEPPYAMSIIAVGEAVMTLADKKIDHALDIWAECLANDTWPAYPNRTAWAELPPYMAAKFEERQEREKSARPIEEFLNA